ncbi:MAG: hypothetical protein STSR0004_22210 [Peptococcaceae bacterium]
MERTVLDDLEILVKKGIYPSKMALISDALRSLLRSKPELKGKLAVELYKEKKVSLSKAAEMAGLNLEDFKELLREENVSLNVPPTGREKVKKEAKIILGLRENESTP